MMAAVFTAATMYARLGVPETPRYTLYVQNDLKATNKDMEGVLKQEFAATDDGAAAAGAANGDAAARESDAKSGSTEALRAQSYNSTAALTTASSATAAATATTTQPVRLTTRQILRKFGWQLFGCCSTWFLLDIAFYSQGLFQSTIYTEIGVGRGLGRGEGRG